MAQDSFIFRFAVVIALAVIICSVSKILCRIRRLQLWIRSRIINTTFRRWDAGFADCVARSAHRLLDRRTARG